ncbi:MAG: tRNA uridine-5-carboxymethylaminomethyl(34) synthesis GTPase MnmE [Desulfuromonadaceae bacterium]|nr:tRNA uridine-5-carboxymethylaminomethyl(34) synthesis GTPase MnmE [Desulfuromonadaceae bacterium]
MVQDADTIAALATAPGPAGVSVLRISGTAAFEIAQRLLPLPTKLALKSANTFFHTLICDPQSGESIDDALVLIFKKPHSYTGEDTIEIQGHGGNVPAQRLLESALLAGARLAEAGEFSKRAFLNGRLDLTQVDAICDLINARTARAAAAAHAQLNGVLGDQINSLYATVTELAAEIEYLLDFEFEILPANFIEDKILSLEQWAQQASQLVDGWHEGRLLRDGALVVICGPPNVGKSSLLNTLLGHQRAIVHDRPGTTRDSLEEGYAIEGMPLRLVDTAGLRISQDAVESQGIQRTRQLMSEADLLISLIDSTVPLTQLAREELATTHHQHILYVLTKCDLPAAPDLALPTHIQPLSISAKTGAGLPELKQKMLQHLQCEREAHRNTFLLSLRHVTELRQALAECRQTVACLQTGEAALVLAANHLRQAAEALGRITGRVYSDDLLDMIFARFCVGK